MGCLHAFPPNPHRHRMELMANIKALFSSEPASATALCSGGGCGAAVAMGTEPRVLPVPNIASARP